LIFIIYTSYLIAKYEIPFKIYDLIKRKNIKTGVLICYIMIIKDFGSSIAGNEISNVIIRQRRHFDKCINYNHDFVSIIYLSSLLISYNIKFKNIRILDALLNMVRAKPSRVIFVVRTMAPRHFTSAMRKIQENSVKQLLTNSYLLVFDDTLWKGKQLLNHAKFLIAYNLCFTEKEFVHSKFYGSTNFTSAGLGVSSRGSNYEEFTSSRKTSTYLSSGDLYYLKRIYNHIQLKYLLYTDPKYARQIYLEYAKYIDTLLKRRIPKQLDELYMGYIESLIGYFGFISLLEGMPGKKLTDSILDSVLDKHPPPNPFELEMLITPRKHAEKMASILGWSEDNIFSMLERTKSAISSLKNSIEDRYLGSPVDKFFIDEEREFMEFLSSFYSSHNNILYESIERWHQSVM